MRSPFICLSLTISALLSLAGCGTTEPVKPQVTTVDVANQQDSGPATSARSGLPGVASPDVPAATPVVAPSPRVDKMELASLPIVANLDDKPGPDGVSITLRLYSLDQPLAFALKQGMIEFVLYEGSIKDAEIGEAEPFHAWRFSASQINQSGRKTLVGWQYALSLNWVGHAPSTSVVTLVARIPRPGGTPIYARPVHLAMGPR